MKSAIEEHGLASLVCKWWTASNGNKYQKAAVDHCLYGASCVHKNALVREELYFLSEIAYEKRMLP